MRRFIISGGGTGGHIFPAISIADALRAEDPECEILFVGAKGKMEMERVPKAGYKIIGLPVAGLQRKLSLKNLVLPFKVLASLVKARSILRNFKPDVAVGVGGYASAPLLMAASKMGIPCLIQEQNSYAGVTNKLLAKKAQKICVAYDGMEKFFPAEKIENLGNPVRQSLLSTNLTKEEAAAKLGLTPGRKTILIVGGSLGARTINESVMQHLEQIAAADAQILWQTGKYYHESILQQLSQKEPVANLKVTDFISDMGAAYRAADLVVSRAGASSISEFCLLGMPVILVPSPNVAENHQYHNAMALVKNDAAIYVADAEAPEKLMDTALATVTDAGRLKTLSTNIKKMAKPNSAEEIADRVLAMVNINEK
jgi:UDP-N-acetylglucosamine--N-acetylmuramyl-(pentapeptide) pyrophosphoryl-undecaprenol N-acetylglucosamine transferase